MQVVRIYEIPDCKMVSSGAGMFGEEAFDRFDSWLSSLPRGIFPKDFLYMENGRFYWLYIFEDGMTAPDGFEIIDFKGGLYAVSTGVDGNTDIDAMNAEKERFLSEHGFERDYSRPELGNVITPPDAQKIMGFCQMDYYTPIVPKQTQS